MTPAGQAPHNWFRNAFAGKRRTLPPIPDVPLTLIFGVARSGKSDLLYRCLLAELQRGGAIVVIDPQEMPPIAAAVLGRQAPDPGPPGTAAAAAGSLSLDDARHLWERMPLTPRSLAWWNGNPPGAFWNRMQPLLQALGPHLQTRAPEAPRLALFLNQPPGHLDPAVLSALCDAAGCRLRLAMTFPDTSFLKAAIGPDRAAGLLKDRSGDTATLWLRSPDDPDTTQHALDGLAARQLRRLRRAYGTPLAFPAGTYLLRVGNHAVLHRGTIPPHEDPTAT